MFRPSHLPTGRSNDCRSRMNADSGHFIPLERAAEVSLNLMTYFRSRGVQVAEDRTPPHHAARMAEQATTLVRGLVWFRFLRHNHSDRAFD